MIDRCSGLVDGLSRLHQYETGAKDQTEPPKNECLAPNVVLVDGKDSGRPGLLYGRHDFGLSEVNSRSSKLKRRSRVPNSPDLPPPLVRLEEEIHQTIIRHMDPCVFLSRIRRLDARWVQGRIITTVDMRFEIQNPLYIYKRLSIPLYLNYL
ncbi:hypothetical protein GCG54_00013181 [Colletotrichum gloeosporioides]|uniref:Uncharacterized protein n=1 Tax=Colletotrichum gloeosporioides TaxID=474922 RepID=A0A8H4FE27_COLGL|nr:uncharacterized protein GCG54_00013181 [Colletotrichum gloeosporioides]KAF3798441.1 hypothetical protein GCG54_00013181 [Colletotrichum gloeosporioides]